MNPIVATSLRIIINILTLNPLRRYFCLRQKYIIGFLSLRTFSRVRKDFQFGKELGKRRSVFILLRFKGHVVVLESADI